MHLRNLLLSILLPLALSQTIQTRVSCLSDGQCITDRGEDAVCGKLEASASAKLPVVEGFGEDYTITIDLSAPLADDLNPSSEEPCTGRDCPANASVPNCDVKSGCENQEQALLESANDPRNPTLGGVGCETPAFRKACQKCCVQTDILSRLSFRDDSRRATRENGEVVCEVEGKCGAEDSDDDALRLATRRSRQDCFRAAPLGFYRTPRPRFFQRCTQLSSTICGAGLRRCRDFS